MALSLSFGAAADILSTAIVSELRSVALTACLCSCAALLTNAIDGKSKTPLENRKVHSDASNVVDGNLMKPFENHEETSDAANAVDGKLKTPLQNRKVQLDANNAVDGKLRLPQTAAQEAHSDEENANGSMLVKVEWKKDFVEKNTPAYGNILRKKSEMGAQPAEGGVQVPLSRASAPSQQDANERQLMHPATATHSGAVPRPTTTWDHPPATPRGGGPMFVHVQSLTP